MEDRFKLFKNIVLLKSPDQIEQEEWLEHGDIWQLASWVKDDVYFYIGIDIVKLKNLYYA